MKKQVYKSFREILIVATLFIVWACDKPSDAERIPVIISTDIGGSDPDDFQSMVHLLVYADRLDIKGLISSPPHDGRATHILEAIEAYEEDYPNLVAQNEHFPSPDHLREVTKQGAIDAQETAVPTQLSEGAQWIIHQAKRIEEPLYVLVWGSMTDVAQALHVAPDIKKMLRVYSIGSWNTVQDSLSRNYVYNHHQDLWWIESNTTFRGMYMGGYQEKDYGNLSFVEAHIKGHGALGDLFYTQKKDIKMGDTPSVLYLLDGDPSNPEGDSWGGAYIPTDHGPQYWTDNPADSLIENNRPGAKTVNKYRKAYLDDWAHRMKWLKEK